jgi:hypothetical protein
VVAQQRSCLTGYALYGGGDPNADGRADLIIGATNVDAGDFAAVGETHVVFGRARQSEQ